MAKSDIEAAHWASPERIQARAKLREVAKAISDQTGRDMHGVIELLVEAQARTKYVDSPEVIPSHVKFQMGSHHSDVLREAVYDVMAILAEPDDTTDAVSTDPVLRARREMFRQSAAQYIQDHPWPPRSN